MGVIEIIQRWCDSFACDRDFVDTPTTISNRNITGASASVNAQTGEPTVVVEFDDDATGELARVTATLFAQARTGVSGRLVIKLDGETLVPATVTSPITCGGLQIVGDITADQASALAAILTAPPLPTSLRLTKHEVVPGPLPGPPGTGVPRHKRRPSSTAVRSH